MRKIRKHKGFRKLLSVACVAVILTALFSIQYSRVAYSVDTGGITDGLGDASDALDGIEGFEDFSDGLEEISGFLEDASEAMEGLEDIMDAVEDIQGIIDTVSSATDILGMGSGSECPNCKRGPIHIVPQAAFPFFKILIGVNFDIEGLPINLQEGACAFWECIVTRELVIPIFHSLGEDALKAIVRGQFNNYRNWFTGTFFDKYVICAAILATANPLSGDFLFSS